MNLRDQTGAAVALGTVLGRGGEGVVHACLASDDLAAKIYSKAPTEARTAKLTWMVAHLTQHPDLGQWCTWPQSLLFDDDERCVGFVMQRLHELRPIHEIYQPEQRKAVLPTAGWDFLARVAANCARMFASLHKYEVVVGDVNERNIFVDSDATVHLVDCDSFQIRTADAFFGTGVGVVDYTPPEMQGVDFRLVERTVEHDRFGLAVMTFKLLLMGRHPFSGGAAGDLREAIANRDWDYPQLAQRLRHLLPWPVVPPPLRERFTAAFTELQRPSAEAWVDCLAAFEAQLQPCRKEPLHKIPAGTGACPWCAIERVAGYAYFSRPQLEWQSQWRSPLEWLPPLDAELEALPTPRQPEEWQAPQGMEAAIATARALLHAERAPDLLSWYLGLAGGLVALGGAVMLLFHPLRGLVVAGAGAATVLTSRWLTARRQLPWQRESKEIELKIKEMRDLEAEWKGEALRLRDQDRRLRAWLQELRGQVIAIDGQRQDEIHKLEGDAVPEGLRAGLQRFELAPAAIPGVAVEKKRALAIRGILTAADLDRKRLAQIPGLAPAQLEALIAFRRSAESRLTGSRAHGPSPAQLAAIDANFQHIRDNLLADMRETLGGLRDAGRLADARMAELMAHGRTAGLTLQARIEDVRRQYVDH